MRDDKAADGRVSRVITMADSGARIMLYSWGSSDEDRLENIVCLAADGSPRWRARLPGTATYDCFVTLDRDGDSLLAMTWSGNALRLDPATGEALAA